MNGSDKSYFILELPLRTSPADEACLHKRLEAGRQLYNGCLGEALKRLALMQQSRAYRRTVSMAKGRERSRAFRDLRKQFGLTDPAMQSHAIRLKNACHIRDHLDTHTAQKIASRAFGAVIMYATGKRGRPRFKSRNRFNSIEGKTNASGIRYRDGQLKWKGLDIPCMVERDDPVVRHGLSSPVRYNRILRRNLNGGYRFYIQLILEGKPYQKPANRIGGGTVSLDVGVSTVAYFNGRKAGLREFCPGLNRASRKIRLIQRAMDRSKRASNPENFNEDGTVKSGKLRWSFSKRYIRLRAKLAEAYRRQAAQRKSLHGRLANEVLSYGRDIRVESQSYREFQGKFGRVAGYRAPGLFVAMLARKAGNAGGSVVELNTGALMLSSRCHCGKTKTKPLSQRWHICDCGVVAQRDLYSAYLGYFAKGDTLDTLSARRCWEGAESLLQQAVSRAMESAIERSVPFSFGVGRIPRAVSARLQSLSGSPVNSCGASDEAGDAVPAAVAVGESPGESAVNT